MKKHKAHSFLFQRLRGFSLVEIAIALVIIGVVASIVMKGKDLLELAKVRSVVQDIEAYRMAITLYQETFYSLPGDDPKAQEYLGEGASNGDGDGVIGETDAALFWDHLTRAGFLHSSKVPSSKFGGTYHIVYNPGETMKGHWIRLGQGIDGKKGLLTPRQAQLLKSKAEQQGDSAFDPQKGTYRIGDGEGSSLGTCLNNGKLNISNSAQVCVVYAAF